MTPSLIRPIYLTLGIGLCALGYVGAVVPVMPSTDFFLLALVAFGRSSPRLEHWLLTRSIAAPALRDWKAERAIRPKVKWIAIVWLWASLVISILAVKRLWLKILLVAIGVGVTAFLATRPAPKGPSEA